MFNAKVIEHSRAWHDGELFTLQLCYPRFIHAEFMTHRVFSRNASSSRAIPVAKMIEQVRHNPAMPVHWGKNQPGMQAREELSGAELMVVKQAWRDAAHSAADKAEKMTAVGAHKQVANRILEPFQWMHVIVTGTDWDNFFALRDHPDAEPNIQLLAKMMRTAMAASFPRVLVDDVETEAGWHLPYVSLIERAQHRDDPELLARVSAARCARVSFLNHDGTEPIFSKDLELFERLVGSEPMHASPVEHQAFSAPDENERSNNLRGFTQFREVLENLKAAATH